MHHRIILEDEEGHTVQEFDSEAIDYFVQGLEKLKQCEPGEEVSTASIAFNPSGDPKSTQLVVFRRVADGNSR